MTFKVGWGIFLFALNSLVLAQGIQVKEATLELEDGYYVLNADFNVQLSHELKKALEDGVVFNFILEAEVKYPRWYWFNKTMAHVIRQWAISYNTLTYQYRFSVGSLYQNVENFDQLIRFLSHVKSLKLIDEKALIKNTTYEVQMRLRLDTSELPALFQMNALTSSDWKLTSDWYRFRFSKS